jgi:adenylate kinase
MEEQKIKRVFCSSIAGSNEKIYLEKFKRYCENHGKEVEIFHHGQIMLELAKREYPHINKYNLINFPESSIKSLRAAAFEHIFSQMSKKKVTIIDAHVSLWIKGAGEPAINSYYLSKFDPDMYVQIFDLPINIYKKFAMDDEILPENKPSLEELFRWHNLEMHTNKILAQEHQKPFYLIAHSQPASTLYNLIFEPRKIPIYQCYPVTHMFKKKDKMKLIQDHISKMNEIATVFDPGAVELFIPDGSGRIFRRYYDAELDMKKFIKWPRVLNWLKKIGGAKNKKMKELAKEVMCYLLEAHNMRLMDTEIVKRDMQLIDQSKMVVVYFPELIYSSGVEFEINYAAKTGKPVWIIKPPGYAGPFTEYNCDRAFNSPEECRKALKKLIDSGKV